MIRYGSFGFVTVVTVVPLVQIVRLEFAGFRLTCET